MLLFGMAACSDTPGEWLALDQAYNEQLEDDQLGDEWLTLDQIGFGIFIKREDRFLRVSGSTMVLAGNAHVSRPLLEDVGFGANLFLRNPLHNVYTLLPDDHLVFAGDLTIELHALESTGDFVARYSESSRYFSRRNREQGYIEPSSGNTGFTGRRYTHIDGMEIASNPHLEQHIFNIVAREGASTSLLVGNSGQRFTLGRWEGTQWVERTLTANREAFSPHSVPHTFDRTFDSYFILDFQRPPEGTNLAIGWRINPRAGAIGATWMTDRNMVQIGTPSTQ